MYASTSFSCSGVVNCLTNSCSGANTKAATPNIVSGRVENTSIFVFSSPETGKFIADYVLNSYGTGAVMVVPAHDERDHEFAQKFDLPIVQVIEGGDVQKEAYIVDGVHINSDFLNGMDKEEAIDAINNWLEENGVGEKKVNYRLRDWLF